jgi:hypothetical protein
MKKFLINFLILLAVPLSAAERYTVTVTVTNEPAINDKLYVNSENRTWKTNVTSASTQILFSNGMSNGTMGSNLYTHVANYEFDGAIVLSRISNGIKLTAPIGTQLTVSNSGGWAALVKTTNAASTIVGVGIPFSSESTATQRTNIASQIVAGINQYATNMFIASISGGNSTAALTTNNNTFSVGKTNTFNGVLLAEGEAQLNANVYYNGTLNSFSGDTLSVSTITNIVTSTINRILSVNTSVEGGMTMLAGNTFTNNGTLIVSNATFRGAVTGGTASTNTQNGRLIVNGTMSVTNRAVFGAIASTFSNIEVVGGSIALANNFSTTARTITYTNGNTAIAYSDPGLILYGTNGMQAVNAQGEINYLYGTWEVGGPITFQEGQDAVFLGSCTITNVSAYNLNMVADGHLAFAVSAMASTNVDFTLGNYQTISVTTNIAFTGSGYSAGRSVSVKLLADGVNRNLGFPAGWKFIGAAAPTSITANKTAILSLTAFGNDATNVVAGYAVEP